MKKEEVRVFNSTADIYDQKYNVVISDNVYVGLKRAGLWKEFSKGHDKRQLKRQMKDVQGMFTHMEKSDFYVLLIKWDSGPDIVAHECFHFVCKMLTQKGVYLSPDSEEAYAYALDYSIRVVLGMQSLAVKERNEILDTNERTN